MGLQILLKSGESFTIEHCGEIITIQVSKFKSRHQVILDGPHSFKVIRKKLSLISSITENEFTFKCSLRFYNEGTAVQIDNSECLNGWSLFEDQNKFKLHGMGWECALGGEFADIYSAINYINDHKDEEMLPWPG